MTLAERKTKLEADLTNARQQANAWATNVIGLEAQLKLVMDMLEEPPANEQTNRRPNTRASRKMQGISDGLQQGRDSDAGDPDVS